jgi:sec-independent protein translocase protein TatA
MFRPFALGIYRAWIVPTKTSIFIHRSKYSGESISRQWHTVPIDVREIIFMGGISVWQLLIILVIVVLLFGTKRLKGIGTDLGGAIKGFKKAVTEEDKDADFEQKKQVEEKSAAEPVSTKTQSDVKEKS